MLQIVRNDTYSEKADRQYSSASKNIFTRGTIFFQNKDKTLVSGATLRSGFIVAVNPQILINPEEVYEKIKDIVPIERDVFITKATKKILPTSHLLLPVSSLTTDNAGMIALVAYFKYLQGKTAKYGKVGTDPNLRIKSWQ